MFIHPSIRYHVMDLALLATAGTVSPSVSFPIHQLSGNRPLLDSRRPGQNGLSLHTCMYDLELDDRSTLAPPPSYIRTGAGWRISPICIDQYKSMCTDLQTPSERKIDAPNSLAPMHLAAIHAFYMSRFSAAYNISECVGSSVSFCMIMYVGRGVGVNE